MTTESRYIWRTDAHEDAVYGVNWSPDGQRIASTAEDRRICVFNAASGEILLRGITGFVNSTISWSPNGRRLVWGANGEDPFYSNIARIFNAATGKALIDCKGHTGYVLSASWSPDGRRVASCSSDQTIRVWNPADGSSLHCLEGHNDWVRDICWSPDGLRIVSSSTDKSLRVWNTRTGNCIFICEGHKDEIWSVDWSPDGGILASADSRNVILWDAEKGTQLLQLEHDSYGVSFSPDSTRLASVGDDLRIFDVTDFHK